MGLIPGICTQCGGTLSVEEGKDAMVCPYCQTPFIVEKAIQKFNNTYNISAQNVYIQGGGKEDFEISGGTLVKYNGSSLDVVIPETVVFISEKVFEGSYIQSIVIPPSVKGIARAAFAACRDLRKVELSDNMTEIAEWAFHDCKRLESVHLPASLQKIGEYAFAGCKNLKEMQLPETLKVIDKCALACTGLERLVLPGSIKELGHSSLFAAPIKEIFMTNHLYDKWFRSAIDQPLMKYFYLPEEYKQYYNKFHACYEKIVVDGVELSDYDLVFGARLKIMYYLYDVSNRTYSQNKDAANSWDAVRTQAERVLHDSLRGIPYHTEREKRYINSPQFKADARQFAIKRMQNWRAAGRCLRCGGDDFCEKRELLRKVQVCAKCDHKRGEEYHYENDPFFAN